MNRFHLNYQCQQERKTCKASKHMKLKAKTRRQIYDENKNKNPSELKKELARLNSIDGSQLEDSDSFLTLVNSLDVVNTLINLFNLLDENKWNEYYNMSLTLLRSLEKKHYRQDGNYFTLKQATADEVKKVYCIAFYHYDGPTCYYEEMTTFHSSKRTIMKTYLSLKEYLTHSGNVADITLMEFRVTKSGWNQYILSDKGSTTELCWAKVGPRSGLKLSYLVTHYDMYPNLEKFENVVKGHDLYRDFEEIKGPEIHELD
jgi:hypothetical protein